MPGARGRRSLPKQSAETAHSDAHIVLVVDRNASAEVRNHNCVVVVGDGREELRRQPARAFGCHRRSLQQPRECRLGAEGVVLVAPVLLRGCTQRTARRQFSWSMQGVELLSASAERTPACSSTRTQRPHSQAGRVAAGPCRAEQESSRGRKRAEPLATAAGHIAPKDGPTRRQAANHRSADGYLSRAARFPLYCPRLPAVGHPGRPFV